MTSYWKTLSHNGVAVPESRLPEGLSVEVRGREVSLPPLAEEMAYHLAKKKDTQYIKDPYFVTNFMKDFAGLLPIGAGARSSRRLTSHSSTRRSSERRKRRRR